MAARGAAETQATLLSPKSRSACARTWSQCSGVPTSVAPDALTIWAASAAWSKCAWPRKTWLGLSWASSPASVGT